MEHERLWEQHLARYQAGALRRSLPFYRDWRLPFYDACRGTRLGGLSVFFYESLPLPQALTLHLDLPGEPKTPAIGWRALMSEEALTFTPVFRYEGLPKPITAPTLSLDLFTRKLGFQVVPGKALAYRGNDLVIPADYDPHDQAAETLRLVAHLLWQRSGAAGYWGAEFLGAILAAALDVNTAQLLAPTELVGEDLTLEACTALALEANRLAGDALNAAFGEDARQTFLDEIAEPETVIKPGIPESLMAFAN